MKTIEWAAGLFEGEGSLSKDKQNLWTLKVGMTDEDVVNAFADICELKVNGPYHPTGDRKHHKKYWVTKSKMRSKVRYLVEKLLPYLGERRAYNAQNCLDEIDNYFYLKQNHGYLV